MNKNAVIIRDTEIVNQIVEAKEYYERRNIIKTYLNTKYISTIAKKEYVF